MLSLVPVGSAVLGCLRRTTPSSSRSLAATCDTSLAPALLLHRGYDWLMHHLFESIEEVQDHATNGLWTYNNERPNMGIGGVTPKQKLTMAA